MRGRARKLERIEEQTREPTTETQKHTTRKKYEMRKHEERAAHGDGTRQMLKTNT
jgi:hypothetical protein